MDGSNKVKLHWSHYLGLFFNSLMATFGLLFIIYSSIFAAYLMLNVFNKYIMDINLSNIITNFKYLCSALPGFIAPDNLVAYPFNLVRCLAIYLFPIYFLVFLSALISGVKEDEIKFVDKSKVYNGQNRQLKVENCNLDEYVEYLMNAFQEAKNRTKYFYSMENFYKIINIYETRLNSYNQVADFYKNGSLKMFFYYLWRYLISLFKISCLIIFIPVFYLVLGAIIYGLIWLCNLIHLTFVSTILEYLALFVVIIVPFAYFVLFIVRIGIKSPIRFMPKYKFIDASFMLNDIQNDYLNINEYMYSAQEAYEDFLSLTNCRINDRNVNNLNLFKSINTWEKWNELFMYGNVCDIEDMDAFLNIQIFFESFKYFNNLDEIESYFYFLQALNIQKSDGKEAKLEEYLNINKKDSSVLAEENKNILIDIRDALNKFNVSSNDNQILNPNDKIIKL